MYVSIYKGPKQSTLVDLRCFGVIAGRVNRESRAKD